MLGYLTIKHYLQIDEVGERYIKVLPLRFASLASPYIINNGRNKGNNLSVISLQIRAILFINLRVMKNRKWCVVHGCPLRLRVSEASRFGIWRMENGIYKSTLHRPLSAPASTYHVLFIQLTSIQKVRREARPVYIIYIKRLHAFLILWLGVRLDFLKEWTNFGDISLLFSRLKTIVL